MIHMVRIQNFKSLRDVSVELERFTVFVGANGSGKTSVLEAIDNAVLAASGGDPKEVFAHERQGDWIYTRGGVGDLSIQCETESGLFSVESTPPSGYPPPPELMRKSQWLYRTRASEASFPRRTRAGPEDGVPAVECGCYGQAIVLTGRPATGRVHRGRPGFRARRTWR